jgi:hypothetical protein
MSKRLSIAVAFTIAFAAPAMAAPFCAVFSFGRQCFYYSMDAR